MFAQTDYVFGWASALVKRRLGLIKFAAARLSDSLEMLNVRLYERHELAKRDIAK